MKHKHHVDVVEHEIHAHPEKYPAINPSAQIPDSQSAQEKEVQQFDKMYKLPKEPEPHIKPSLWLCACYNSCFIDLLEESTRMGQASVGLSL